MNFPPIATSWLVLGTVLISAEFFIPGLTICFFGLSALIVGILYLLVPTLSSGLALLLFGVLSVVFLLGVRRFIPKTFHGNTEHAVENPDEDEVAGETAVVSEAITPARKGSVDFRGSRWLAASKTPHAVGDVVTVVRRENLTLHVR